MPDDQKKLYKVTGLKSGIAEEIMKGGFKDLRLTNDRSMCFVRIFPKEEEALAAWCTVKGFALFERIAEWRQVVPAVS